MIKKYIYGALSALLLNTCVTKAADTLGLEDNQAATSQTQSIVQNEEVEYSLTAKVEYHVFPSNYPRPPKFYMTGAAVDIYENQEALDANTPIAAMDIKVHMVEGTPTDTMFVGKLPVEKLTFSSRSQNLMMKLYRHGNCEDHMTPTTMPLPHSTPDISLEFSVSEDPMLQGSYMIHFLQPK